MTMPSIIYLDPEDEADKPLAIWLQMTYKWGDDKGIRKIMVGRHSKNTSPRGLGDAPDRLEHLTVDRAVLVYHRPLEQGYVVHVSAELPPEPLAGGVDFLPRVAV
jgi:hypothetical protein